ncbi:zinc-dependent metalloprotease [Polaribacter sp. IC073]|uniref:zinc-dependent metalloprotease n=1 Tax=Polaribacter sp. IC073 TaxID=2508540 RepID=UPI0011BEC2C9|nr:zinc-dependent metalloprotease [Polaribacter sp. IC073]TXD48718.1 zinc-dependent metalloprotease [Polaribacter sp. IC073]
MKKLLLFSLLIVFLFPLDANSQSGRIKKRKNKKTEKNATKEPETKAKTPVYTDFVKKDTKTAEGLFKVHENKDTFLYEIPKSFLGKEMLLVTRIKEIPADLGGGYVNAGSKINTQVIVWEQYKNKIFLKVKSYNAIANDSLPIYKSVKANNLEPIIYAFDVKSENEDATAILVDVTKFFSTDVKAITGLPAYFRKTYKVRKLDTDRSFIRSIKSYPKNIEVVQDFTFDADEPPSNLSTNTITMRINQSMILLPEKPMMSRVYDKRVGYFSLGNVDYNSEALKADSKRYIKRWRLEPKDEAAYNRGELVEPKKPIVYYLDPATPIKLRKYIKQGVDDWQKVFETAGFKNAIMAKMPPTKEEDPEFSMEDVRYSSIRYVASTTRNAVGPSVSDPRSGEILESDIIWYHNHLRSYRNRYLLETGAANPSARTLKTSDEEIGDMMRMVIAHEVGHALGLPHNMAASFAYPTDSLRSGDFTQKNGIAATIMDYARYNYVAQPGDKNIRFIRQLGPYDHYSINWGYRKIPNIDTPEAEVKTLDKWIEEKADNPIYRFGGERFDPSAQTEGIGNDQVKASSYGIKNLKIVAKNLPNWTSNQTNDYEDLSELYGELLSVWNRYVGHVAGNIGGVYEFNKKPSQSGNIYVPVTKSKQKESLNWLQKNVFETQDWLLDQNILNKIDEAGYIETMSRYQNRFLRTLLNSKTLKRMMDAEVIQENNYAAVDMISDLRSGIFSETSSTKNVAIYRRNLQKSFISNLNSLMNDASVKNTDISSIVRGELTTLKYQLNSASKRAVNKITKYHYKDAIVMIDAILDPK